MKKVIKQLYYWISKYKKKLIYGALALFIGQICFFNFWWIWVQNEAFAQTQSSATTTNNNPTQNQTAEKSIEKRSQHLSFFQKVVYVLIYPMLMVAGKLADNSFVYWEVFWFDAVLWHLWNIIRNLANFALWFIFVYKIFEYLLKEKSWNIKELLIKSLLAWIWIQASWFVMAALIDISTVLTYWIWWLPISILWNESEDGYNYNPYMLKNVIDVDINSIDKYEMYLTSTINPWSYYISQCKTFSYASWSSKEELILAPSKLYYKEKSGANVEIKMTDRNRCHYYGQVYYFWAQGSYVREEATECLNAEECPGDNSNCVKCSDLQNKYDKAIANAIDGIITWNTASKSWYAIIEDIRAGRILEIWDAHVTGGVVWIFSPSIVYDENDKYWLDKDNKRTGSWWTTSQLKDILQWNSYVGVFTSLYSSLMNSWKWILPSDAGLFAWVLNIALSLWHLIAIWIPLIIVAIIFMMRIWILWVAIAISPFIVLLSVFKDLWDKVFSKGFLEYFSLKNLIPIIFSPAIICFAISMSTVLVVIISGLNVDPIQWQDASIWGWLITMKIGDITIPLGKLVISILWIAITWFIVWAAVKTSKLWESSIVTSIESLSKNALWSIPIVPIPTKTGVRYIGANTAFGLNGNRSVTEVLWDDVKDKFTESDNKAVRELLNPDEVKQEAESKQKENRIEEYKEGISKLTADKIDSDWREQKIAIWTWWDSLTFNEIDDTKIKKDIIEKINGISDEDVRKAFGKVPSIQIWQWDDAETYDFDTKQNKYVLKPKTNQPAS